MAVTAVSAVAQARDSAQQQYSGMRQSLNNLQAALSAGNLEQTQKALTRVRQDIQNLRPPINGVRPSPALNPQATLRADMQALQSALDSGDLPGAQQAFLRMVQDSQQVTKAQSAGQDSGTKALPGQTSEENATGPHLEKETGNLLDVMA